MESMPPPPPESLSNPPKDEWDYNGDAPGGVPDLGETPMKRSTGTGDPFIDSTHRELCGSADRVYAQGIVNFMAVPTDAAKHFEVPA
jgi:hypothetical protein